MHRSQTFVHLTKDALGSRANAACRLSSANWAVVRCTKVKHLFISLKTHLAVEKTPLVGCPPRSGRYEMHQSQTFVHLISFHTHAVVNDFSTSYGCNLRKTSFSVAFESAPLQ